MQQDGEISYLGNQYSQGDELAGKYLNVDTDGKYATNQYHQTTYGGYDSVQKSAEPLYWRSDEQETLPGKENANALYVNYYILHISWEKRFRIIKETDMVYLMAGVTSRDDVFRLISCPCWHLKLPGHSSDRVVSFQQTFDILFCVNICYTVKTREDTSKRTKDKKRRYIREPF